MKRCGGIENEAAGWELRAQRPRQIKGAYHLVMLVPVAMRSDADNVLKAMQDLLQSHAVIEDDRIDRRPVRLERGVRTRLVGPHHAGIAGDVSADDGSQASFHVP